MKKVIWKGHDSKASITCISKGSGYLLLNLYFSSSTGKDSKNIKDKYKYEILFLVNAQNVCGNSQGGKGQWNLFRSTTLFYPPLFFRNLRILKQDFWESLIHLLCTFPVSLCNNSKGLYISKSYVFINQ